MKAKTIKKKIPRQPQIRNAVDFKSIYVNFAQTAASAGDISVGVGEAMPTLGGVVEVEMKARIVMAPLQAKIMFGMLFQVIQQYEQQYGKIVIPPNVAAQLAGAVLEGSGADRAE